MFSNVNRPKSYDKETIAAYLNNLNLKESNQSLVELREKRNYLSKAFSVLVEQEWKNAEETERKQRMEELKSFCAAAVNLDEIIPDIDEFLTQSKDELQQLHRSELNLWQSGQQLQAQQQLQLDDDAIVVPGERRKVVTRARFSTSGRRALLDRNVEHNQENATQRIRDLFKNAARSYELNDGMIEPIDEELAIETPTERIEQHGPTRWLSENFMTLREMRKLHFSDPSELHEPLPWPSVIDERIWLANRQPQLALNMWFVHRPSESRQEQEQLDLEPALPRQDVQSRSQNTPSHGGLLPLVGVQDSGRNAAPMISSNAASISNDGYILLSVSKCISFPFHVSTCLSLTLFLNDWFLLCHSFPLSLIFRFHSFFSLSLTLSLICVCLFLYI